MADTAAHLVDRVLPSAPYRPWMLSAPKRRGIGTLTALLEGVHYLHDHCK